MLADGRRGLAVGAATAALGLAVIVLQGTGALEAGVLMAGGVVASARRFGSGPSGWRIMPAGSTPRFILCVAVGILAVWFALAATTGRDPALRFAAVSVIALSGARALSGGQPAVALTAVAVLSLAVGAASGFDVTAPALWPCLAAAIVSAGVCSLPLNAAPDRA